LVTKLEPKSKKQSDESLEIFESQIDIEDEINIEEDLSSYSDSNEISI